MKINRTEVIYLTYVDDQGRTVKILYRGVEDPPRALGGQPPVAGNN